MKAALNDTQISESSLLDTFSTLQSDKMRRDHIAVLVANNSVPLQCFAIGPKLWMLSFTKLPNSSKLCLKLQLIHNLIEIKGGVAGLTSIK